MASAFKAAGPIEHLLYEALETEQGGVEVYALAISCARNEEGVARSMAPRASRTAPTRAPSRVSTDS